jgi:hypothetical protein
VVTLPMNGGEMTVWVAPSAPAKTGQPKTAAPKTAFVERGIS